MREFKRAVREKALALRAALSLEERAEKSRRIREYVLSLPEYQNADTVMLFLNFRDEVETTGLAEQTLALGKKLVLPRTAPRGILIPAFVQDLAKDIEPGTWGIREPKKENLKEADPVGIDFILVPGAAFDMTGNRLGYGGGYYDRFMERLSPTVPRTAVAFQCQVLPEVPTGTHDKKVTILITEEGVHRFTPAL